METTGRLQREPIKYYLVILGDYHPDTSHLRGLRGPYGRFKVYPCKLCWYEIKGTGELLRRYNTKQSFPLEPKCTSMNQIETLLEQV